MARSECWAGGWGKEEVCQPPRRERTAGSRHQMSTRVEPTLLLSASSVTGRHCSTIRTGRACRARPSANRSIPLPPGTPRPGCVTRQHAPDGCQHGRPPARGVQHVRPAADRRHRPSPPLPSCHQASVAAACHRLSRPRSTLAPPFAPTVQPTRAGSRRCCSWASRMRWRAAWQPRWRRLHSARQPTGRCTIRCCRRA